MTSLMLTPISNIGLLYRVRYEFNRPFLEAKDYQDNDALAVEATGYGLITLFLMEGGGVTFLQVSISPNKIKIIWNKNVRSF